MLQNVYVSYSSKGFDKCEVQGGLETTSDLAAFRLSMIVPNFFSRECGAYVFLSGLAFVIVNPEFLGVRPFDYVFHFRRPTTLKEGPAFQYACSRVYIFK